MTNDTLVKVDRAIEAMATELSTDEAINGWTTESKRAMLDYFRDLRHRLVSNVPLMTADFSIARGLDSWGVSGGELANLAVDISNALTRVQTKNA